MLRLDANEMTIWKYQANMVQTFKKGITTFPKGTDNETMVMLISCKEYKILSLSSKNA